MTAALVRTRIKDVGIRWIHRDVRHAGVFANGEDGLPGFARVGGLIQAAISARPPERPFCGNVHNVAVARIDNDPANVFGFFQSKILPALATIFGAVDAIAVGNASLAVALAGSNPDYGRIVGIKRHPTDGIGTFAIKDRSPCSAVVGGLPYPARGYADVI